VSDLTPSRFSIELLEETLLTLEQVTTDVTALALNASRDPEQSPRIRVLLEGLLALIQACEGDLGIYTLN
jgi:hypothetical protein